MALHRGHRQATAVSQRHPPAWRVAMSLFTTIPAGVEGRLDDAVAARARSFWLPGDRAAARRYRGRRRAWQAGTLNQTGPGRLLGAALGVAALASLRRRLAS